MNFRDSGVKELYHLIYRADETKSFTLIMASSHYSRVDIKFNVIDNSYVI